MADQQLPSFGSLPLAGAAETTDVMPEALQAPTHHVGMPFVLTLSFAQMAIYMSFIPTISIMLPLQVQGLDAANKIAVLGAINAVGALVALVANPIAGALSDRTTSRFGRRRPWLLAGAILTPASLLVMMSAQNIPVLVIGLVVLQLSLNLTLAALTAIVPDQIPAEQRGLAGGLIGLSVPIASVVGAVLIGSLIQNMTLRYLVVAGIVLVVLVPYAFLVPDKRLPKGYLPPFHLGTFLKGFWISPREHPDFGLVWLARCVSFLGYFTAYSYLLYYLQDAVHYTRLFPGQPVTQGIASLTVFSTVALLISTVLGGILSDRFGQRKPFVVVSSIMMAIGLLVLAFFQTWIGAIVSEVVLGLGFGAYLAVDQALATQVLPSNSDRAKDMGIINIANTLPQTLAPAIAAPILTLTHSYLVLFVLAGVVTLIGSFIVQPIKSVR
jgi:MFS family permease